MVYVRGKGLYFRDHRLANDCQASQTSERTRAGVHFTPKRWPWRGWQR